MNSYLKKITLKLFIFFLISFAGTPSENGTDILDLKDQTNTPFADELKRISPQKLNHIHNKHYLSPYKKIVRINHNGKENDNMEIESYQISILTDSLNYEMRKNICLSPSKFSNKEKISQKRKFDLIDNPTSLISPSKIARYQELGGSLSELKNKIAKLKEDYPSPIRNPKLCPNDKVFSPVVRIAYPKASRQKQIQARREGLIQSIPPLAFKASLKPETSEEREIRKQKQEQDFQEAEKKRGKLPKNLKNEIRAEYKTWQSFFQYIQLRKDACTTGNKKGKKLRKEEIEDAFARFVAPHLEKITLDGYTVYFSTHTLDMKREDQEGRSNYQRMKDGLCPIGADGTEMNYHHLTAHDYATNDIPCIIVLLTDELHTRYSGNLHFTQKTYEDIPNPRVNRTAFGKYRKRFNKAIPKKLSPCDD